MENTSIYNASRNRSYHNGYAGNADMDYFAGWALLGIFSACAIILAVYWWAAAKSEAFNHLTGARTTPLDAMVLRLEVHGTVKARE